MIRRALSYLAYPAMTGGALLFGFWAIARRWPVWAVGVVAIAAVVPLTALLEWLIPYRPAWAKPRGDRLTDACHMLVSNRGFDVGALIAASAMAPLSAWLPSRLGFRLWPHEWPVLLQALLATLTFELPWYWIHRLEHHSVRLWRIHSVHHSSRRIYWWNFSRNHPFDNLISAAAAYAPLVLCGVGREPLVLMVAFSSAHGLLQHSNIDLRTGFLDLFLSTARVHRWHHSPDRRESASNFSPRVMLWDHLFGSYYFPKNVEPPEDVGLGDGGADFPESFLEQLLIPFRTRYWRERP